jgi:histidyl-tRNA synthetase
MEELTFNTLPGTRDLLPEETRRWQMVEAIARRI